MDIVPVLWHLYIGYGRLRHSDIAMLFHGFEHRRTVLDISLDFLVLGDEFWDQI